MRRLRIRAAAPPKPPTPKSVVGIIDWGQKYYTLAEMHQSPPRGGGIYIMARTATGTPPTTGNKPIIPVSVGKAKLFSERWRQRLETFGNLFGEHAATVLNAHPFNAFGVYIGKFPVEDAPKGRSELDKYLEDMEWVLIRYLKERKKFQLNQSRRLNEVILSEWEGIKITNRGDSKPEFLDEKIEVRAGGTLELSEDELRAGPSELAWEDGRTSPGGRWFRRGRNIVLLLDTRADDSAG
jgi:hypothetical protein